MSTKTSIIAAIESKVITYSYYRIGLTHDLAERKAYWERHRKTKRRLLDCMDSRFAV